MAKPIFVIGRNRSGTKWLSNLIGNHPDVACVQRPGAGGILETNVFTTMPAVFGDLSVDENYLGMAVCFARTNFFRLTGLEERVLFEDPPRDYAGLFRRVMDLYAEKQGASRWLQKAGVYCLADLMGAFGDAAFLVIERDLEPNVRSALGLGMAMHGRKGSVLRETVSYCLAQKRARRWRRRANVMYVRFEDLRADREAVLREACGFLELDFRPEMLEDRFEKNTSFRTRVRREDVLTRRDRAVMRLAAGLCRPLPARLLEALRGRGRRSRQRFVPRTFDLFKQDIGWPIEQGP